MSELCSVPRVSERFAQSNALEDDIARLKYVSGKREEALRRLGIRTVGDLLLHIPHRYLDFTRSWSIEMAPIGTVCTIVATVDRIVRHVVCFCFCDNVSQLAVVCRIRSALFDSDYDLTADDGKDFTFFCVVFFFLMLNIGKF